MLDLHFDLGYTGSLKAKRSILSPLIHRIGRQFTVSIAETGLQDHHTQAVITIGIVSTNPGLIQAEFSSILDWINTYYPGLVILDHHTEVN